VIHADNYLVQDGRNRKCKNILFAGFGPPAVKGYDSDLFGEQLQRWTNACSRLMA
jgi:hypothetical protein